MEGSSGNGAAADFVVEWYRPDRRRQAVRVWSVAVSAVIAGVFLLGATRADALAAGVRIAAGVLGALCTLGGPLWLVLGLHRVFGDDTYVLLRRDCVEVCSRGVLRHVRWDDLEAVAVEPASGALVLRLREGGEVRAPEVMAGVTPAQLVARVEAVRRKAAMGLLRPPDG